MPFVFFFHLFHIYSYFLHFQYILLIAFLISSLLISCFFILSLLTHIYCLLFSSSVYRRIFICPPAPRYFFAHRQSYRTGISNTFFEMPMPSRRFRLPMPCDDARRYFADARHLFFAFFCFSFRFSEIFSFLS